MIHVCAQRLYNGKSLFILILDNSGKCLLQRAVAIAIKMLQRLMCCWILLSITEWIVKHRRVLPFVFGQMSFTLHLGDGDKEKERETWKSAFTSLYLLCTKRSEKERDSNGMQILQLSSTVSRLRSPRTCTKHGEKIDIIFCSLLFFHSSALSWWDSATRFSHSLTQ